MRKWSMPGIILGGILTAVMIIVGIILANNRGAEATNDIDPGVVSRATESLTRIAQNEFGVPKATGLTDLAGEKYIVFQDNKYTYKVKASDGALATLLARDYNHLTNVSENKTKDELFPEAQKYLRKYRPPSNESKYVIEGYQYKNTPTEKYHEFIFHEIASNGVKTGWRVSIWLNNNGDLVSLAVHEGDVEVASQTNPTLNGEDARRIALDFIMKNNPSLGDIENFPATKVDLTVWRNRLAWYVKFDNIRSQGPTLGYDFYIDALTGDILFSDYYCSFDQCSPQG